MIYSRFNPVSLRITSGTEAGFLVCGECSCKSFDSMTSHSRSFFPTGQKDGLVVDSGLRYTRIVPIIDLTPLHFATAMLPIGGEDVSRALARELEEQGESWPPNVIDDIKVKHVFCSEFGDLDSEESEVDEAEYKLPNDHAIVLRAERFRCVRSCKPSGFLVPNVHLVPMCCVHEDPPRWCFRLASLESTA